MDAIAWSRAPVVSGIDVSVQRHTAFAQNCENLIESLADAAVDLGRGDGADPQQVEQLREAVVKLLEARRQGQLQAAALHELKESYQAGQGVTDFVAALSGRAAALAAEQPYDPRADPLHRDFDATARGEAGGAEDEQIDDDIAIEGGAAQLAPNLRCPISSKQILDIEEPVQDAAGVVYEKAAVVGYFRSLHPSKGGRDIIVAGSNHAVTLAELVPAEKVIREKRRQARLQRHAAARGGAAGGGDDVLDV